MQCPVCSTPLQPREREGIEIDVCGRCRGVWLDRGELDRLIARSARHDDGDGDDDDDRQAARGHPPDGYAPPAGYQPRRKGFFSRLFDD